MNLSTNKETKNAPSEIPKSQVAKMIPRVTSLPRQMTRTSLIKMVCAIRERKPSRIKEMIRMTRVDKRLVISY
jgi:hypothetical protein